MNALDYEMGTPKLYFQRSLGQSLDLKSPSITRSKRKQLFTGLSDACLDLKSSVLPTVF